jgi:RNA polymerase sigma-70 factor (ECF subfamily)
VSTIAIQPNTLHHLVRKIGFGLTGTPISNHDGVSSTIVSESSAEVKNAKVRSGIGTMQIVDTETPLNDLTDEQLLGVHAEGREGACEVLIGRYRNELLHFLIRFLGSRAAAEDVFQDTFLQIHLVADSFDTSRRFKPWLYTIAANKARDHHRKQKRRAAASLSAPIGRSGSDEVEFIDLLAGEDENPEVPVSEAEQAQLVKKAVDELPVHYREILLLSYFQKMSYNQIADALDIPLGTVKSRLHSAVGCFAENWKARENANESGGTSS